MNSLDHDWEADAYFPGSSTFFTTVLWNVVWSKRSEYWLWESSFLSQQSFLTVFFPEQFLGFKVVRFLHMFGSNNFHLTNWYLPFLISNRQRTQRTNFFSVIWLSLLIAHNVGDFFHNLNLSGFSFHTWVFLCFLIGNIRLWKFMCSPWKTSLSFPVDTLNR